MDRNIIYYSYRRTVSVEARESLVDRNFSSTTYSMFFSVEARESLVDRNHERMNDFVPDTGRGSREPRGSK